MKLAEYVAIFLEKQGIQHVFGVSGGASLHLIHGITDATQIKFIPTCHEQAAGFAADSYARLRGLCCAIATSGPGATNLVTAIAASYYDSVPTLYITGQVATFRQGSRYGVKFYGFQETPIVEMVKPITKFAKTLVYPSDIRWYLEKAVGIAKQGRQGPVLIDIPDDLQRAEINPEELAGYPQDEPLWQELIPVKVFDLIVNASRPVFIWGAGMRPYAKEALRVAERLRIPVATTWGAIDLIPFNHPLHIGGFGTHGTRPANFAVQNADLLVAIGARLDTKSTGHPPHFSRSAKICMVDIDSSEIAKFPKLGRKIDIGIAQEAGHFINQLSLWAFDTDQDSVDYDEIMVHPGEWIERIWKWKKDYPSKDDPAWKGTKPYQLMQEIAKYTTPNDIIVSDTGTALGYLMQGFPFKGERMVHAWNMTPMGYGLPAAIGAACATGRRVMLITGDGSIMMSLSELATIARWELNVKIILLNNKGHAMCRQTQRQWLGGKYPATSIEGGLGMPKDWNGLVRSFGIPAYECECCQLDELMEHEEGPGFYEIHIDPDAGLIPQARFGAPIEDSEPMLSREELREQMIVEVV